MPDCVFCKIAAKEIPSQIVWENERFVAFLDIKPVNPGHVLIVPKDHVDSIFDLQSGAYGEIFDVAKKLSVPLQAAMDSRRIGIAVEGFGEPHAHLHLIPLNGPGELNLARAKPMDKTERAAIAEKIKNKIKE